MKEKTFKKIIGTVLTAAMLSSGFAMAENEAETIFMEGEYFTIVPLEGTEEKLNVGSLEACSGGKWGNYHSENMSDMTAEFEVPASGMYTMEYVASQQKTTDSQYWLCKHRFDVNGSVFDGSEPASANANYSGKTMYKYTISVYLEKGLNTLKFTPYEKYNNNGASKYIFDLDYVKFTPAEENSVMLEFESSPLSNSTRSKTYFSGGAEGIFYSSSNDTIEVPMTVVQPGSYSLEWRAQPYNTTASWLSKYTVYVNNVKLDSINSVSFSGEGNRSDHTADVQLVKGTNTIKFVMELETANNRYDLYCDYIKLTKTSEPVKSGKVTIELENWTSTENNASGLPEVSDTYLPNQSVYNSTTQTNIASGGKLGVHTLGDVNTTPDTFTYVAKAPAAGNYTFNFDIGAQVENQTWLSAVAVTLTQGDEKILDNVVLQTDTTYHKYTKNEAGDIVDEAVTCEKTVNKIEDLYRIAGGGQVVRYELIDKVALDEGDFELTLAAISNRSNTGTNGYWLVDVATAVRDIDYSKLTVAAEADVINAGSTLQLGVIDDLNTPVGAENAEITWTSSNENILTVDEAGILTAKNPGKAKVTMNAVYDGGNVTAEKEFTVLSSAHKFVVREVSVDEENIVSIKYASLANLDETPVTLIVGRYATEGGIITEVKSEALSGNTPYFYKTAKIQMDDVAGAMKLFTWSDLENMVPVFQAIDIK